MVFVAEYLFSLLASCNVRMFFLRNLVLLQAEFFDPPIFGLRLAVSSVQDRPVDGGEVHVDWTRARRVGSMVSFLLI